MLPHSNRSPLRQALKNLVARRLLAGPFAGMRYVGNACCGNLLPKVLGTYEREIASHLTGLLAGLAGSVIDVGCAEGYYAVGLLFINPTLRVIAFDADAEARSTCLKVAQMNGVQSRLTLKEFCTPDALREVARSTRAKLIIMDIEGGEASLLTQVGGEALADAALVVEIHEEFQPETRAAIREAFQNTHSIDEVFTRQRSAADLEIKAVRLVASCSDALANRLLYERAHDMSWFIMRPVRRVESGS